MLTCSRQSQQLDSVLVELPLQKERERDRKKEAAAWLHGKKVKERMSWRLSSLGLLLGVLSTWAGEGAGEAAVTSQQRTACRIKNCISFFFYVALFFPRNERSELRNGDGALSSSWIMLWRWFKSLALHARVSECSPKPVFFSRWCQKSWNIASFIRLCDANQ